MSPDQRYAVETLALYTGDLGGSNHLQRTKPETVGFALADSPAGQAAWIYEKFQSKTDNHGLAEDALSIDDMLDAISLYWLTNSAASSGRIYWENKSGTFAGPKLTLPVAVTVFPKDIPRLPRSLSARAYRIIVPSRPPGKHALGRVLPQDRHAGVVHFRAPAGLSSRPVARRMTASKAQQ